MARFILLVVATILLGGTLHYFDGTLHIFTVATILVGGTLHYFGGTLHIFDGSYHTSCLHASIFW